MYAQSVWCLPKFTGSNCLKTNAANSGTILDHKRSKASNITRTIALLMADEGPSGPKLTDAQIHVATGFSSRTLERLRKRCCEAGPLGALEGKPWETPGREIKITGDVEARITQLACSAPPAGQAQWTTRLLAGHLVEIEIIDSISHQSVATVLKRSELKPWQQDCWCIPPKQNSAFVAAMEDVLDDVLEVYARPPGMMSRWYASTSSPNNCCPKPALPFPQLPASRPDMTMSTCARAA